MEGKEELDRLDEANRLNDLNCYLDEASFSTFSDGEDAEVLKEFLGVKNEHQNGLSNGGQDDSFDAVNMNNHEVSPTSHLYVTKSPKERYGSFVGDSIDSSSDLPWQANIRPELGYNLSRSEEDTIKRLTNELHLKQVDLQSMQIQLNHVTLQVTALSRSDKELRRDKDRTRLAFAAAEQDKLLLEARLREIGQFEGIQHNLTLDELRGKLLEIANAKITEMSETIANLQRSSMDQVNSLGRQLAELSADKEALLTELASICEQLAQKHIIYTAQERQLLNKMTTQQYEINHKDKTFIEASTKYKVLQEQYDKQTQENIKLHLDKKELQDKLQESQSSEQECRLLLANLQNEFNVLTNNNLHLQSLVDTYQRQDGFNDANIIAEYDKFRKEQTRKEDEYKQQISRIQSQLSEEAKYRDEVLQELSYCKAELNDKMQLLQQVQQSYLRGDSYSPSTNECAHQLQPIAHVPTSNNAPQSSPQQELNKTPSKQVIDESVLMGSEAKSSPPQTNHIRHCVSQGSVNSDAGSVRSDGQSDGVSWLVPNDTEKMLRKEIKRLKAFIEKVIRKNAELREQESKLDTTSDDQMITVLKESIHTLTTDRERLLEQISGYQTEIEQLQDLLQTTMQNQNDSAAKEQMLLGQANTINLLQDEVQHLQIELNNLTLSKEEEILQLQQDKQEMQVVAQTHEESILKQSKALLALQENLDQVQKQYESSLLVKDEELRRLLVDKDRCSDLIHLLEEDLVGGATAIASLHGELTNVRGQLIRESNRSVELESLVQEAAEKLDVLDAAYKASRVKERDADERVKSLGNEVERYKTDLNEAKVIIDQLTSDAIQDKDQLNILLEQKAEYAEVISTLEEDKAQLQVSLAEMESTNEKLAITKTGKESEVALHLSRITDLEESNVALSNTVGSLTQRVKGLEECKLTLESEIASLLDGQVEQCKAIQTYENKLRILEDEKRALVAENEEGVRSLLSQVQLLEESVKCNELNQSKEIEDEKEKSKSLQEQYAEARVVLEEYRRIYSNYLSEIHNEEGSLASLTGYKELPQIVENVLLKQKKDHEVQLSYIEEVNSMLASYQHNYSAQAMQLTEKEQELQALLVECNAETSLLLEKEKELKVLMLKYNAQSSALAEKEHDIQALKLKCRAQSAMLAEKEEELKVMQLKYNSQNSLLEQKEQQIRSYNALSLDKDEVATLQQMIEQLKHTLDKQSKYSTKLIQTHEEEKRDMQSRHIEEISTLKSTLRKAFKKELQYKEREKEALQEKFKIELNQYKALLSPEKINRDKAEDSTSAVTNNELEEVRGKYSELLRRFDLLESHHFQLQDKNRALIGNNEALFKESKSKEVENRELEERIMILVGEKETSIKEQKILERRMATMQEPTKQYESAKAELDGVMKQLYSLQDKHMQVLEKYEQSRAENTLLQGKYETLLSKYKVIKEEQELLQEELQKMQTEQIVLQGKYRALHQDYEVSDKELKNYQDTFLALQKKYSKLLVDYDALQDHAKHTIDSAQVEELKRAQDQYGSLSERYEQLLTEKSSSVEEEHRLSLLVKYLQDQLLSANNHLQQMQTQLDQIGGEKRLIEKDLKENKQVIESLQDRLHSLSEVDNVAYKTLQRNHQDLVEKYSALYDQIHVNKYDKHIQTSVAFGAEQESQTDFPPPGLPNGVKEIVWKEKGLWTVQVDPAQQDGVGLLTVDLLPVTEVQAQLHDQKAKLKIKYHNKMQKLTEMHEKEKSDILTMVKKECEEIVGESQRLLSAKKELKIQQQKLLELIVEMDMKLSPLLLVSNEPSLRSSLSDLRSSLSEKLQSLSAQSMEKVVSKLQDHAQSARASRGLHEQSVESLASHPPPFPPSFPPQLYSAPSASFSSSLPPKHSEEPVFYHRNQSRGAIHMVSPPSHNTSLRISPPQIYPEMLSPHATEELLKAVGQRNQSTHYNTVRHVV